MLDVVAFGRISVGKSALLNAVFGTGAFTVDVRGGSTTQLMSHEIVFDGYNVRVTDTPGFGGVGGWSHAEQARAAARTADLVLVVLDQDLTQTEHDETAALAHSGKPLLVILNKTDALAAADRDRLRDHVRGRLAAMVHPEDVLVCAADPLRYLARENADGSVEEWTERAAPDVEAVRDRLRCVLAAEGHLLRDVDDLSRAAGERSADLPPARERADRLIEQFALGIGAGVALNPIPLIDVFGAGAGLAVLVGQLARCYEQPVTRNEITDLARSLVVDGWKVMWPSAALLLGGQLLKLVPVVGWALSAIGQGTAAFYLTWVIGRACSEYFANNKRWSGSMRETLERVIAATDQRSLSRRAAEQIRRRLEGL